MDIYLLSRNRFSVFLDIDITNDLDKWQKGRRDGWMHLAKFMDQITGEIYNSAVRIRHSETVIDIKPKSWCSIEDALDILNRLMSQSNLIRKKHRARRKASQQLPDLGDNFWKHTLFQVVVHDDGYSRKKWHDFHMKEILNFLFNSFVQMFKFEIDADMEIVKVLQKDMTHHHRPYHVKAFHQKII